MSVGNDCAHTVNEGDLAFEILQLQSFAPKTLNRGFNFRGLFCPTGQALLWGFCAHLSDFQPAALSLQGYFYGQECRLKLRFRAGFARGGGTGILRLGARQ